MTRRDLLSKFTAALAAMGVAGEASAVEAEPKPLFFKFVTDQCLRTEALENVRRSWESIFDGNPPGKLLVFHAGTDIVPVYNKPLPERMKDVAEFCEVMIKYGIFSPNEIRALVRGEFDLPPFTE